MKLYSDSIPENATCVFSGVQFRIWQWPQVEFDGKTATYEMAERVPSLWVVAATEEGKIVLQREVHAHNPDMPFWSLPGGKGDFDEDPLAGAKRELSEESGYASEDWTLFKHEAETAKISWQTYVYIARNAQKTHEPHPDGGEKIEVHAFSPEEFFEHVEREDFRGWHIKDIVTEIRRDPAAREAFMNAIKKQ